MCLRCRYHTIEARTTELTQWWSTGWPRGGRQCLTRTSSGGRAARGRWDTWSQSYIAAVEVHSAVEPPNDLHLPLVHLLVLPDHHVHRRQMHVVCQVKDLVKHVQPITCTKLHTPNDMVGGKNNGSSGAGEAQMLSAVERRQHQEGA
jgi:hypothetical protein